MCVTRRAEGTGRPEMCNVDDVAVSSLAGLPLQADRVLVGYHRERWVRVLLGLLTLGSVTFLHAPYGGSCHQRPTRCSKLYNGCKAMRSCGELQS
jgi:hypothetical protein